MRVLDLHAGDRLRVLRADDLVDRMIPDDLDLGVLEQAVLQDLLRAEVVAPMDDGDALGEVGQEDRFLDGGVASADDHHFLALVEEAVAGGAGRDAVAFEVLFRGDAEPARLGAGADDQRVARIGVAGLALEHKGAPLQIDLGDLVHDDFGADMLGLGAHLLHEPRPLDDIGEARVVLDVGGDGKLAARLRALDQQGVQHGARRVDGGRVARRARSEDQNLCMPGIGHCTLLPGPQKRARGPIRLGCT